MSVPVRGLGFFSCEDKQEEFDFATAYANNLSEIRANYKAAGVVPTERDIQHARIKSAVYAVTDLSNRDSMGSFLSVGFKNVHQPQPHNKNIRQYF